ncbi:MAG: hypothetical protein II645_00960 [Bacteroidaceae bacterium]|nr:hypothetical protein [Bacteroidaceae bacterium]
MKNKSFGAQLVSVAAVVAGIVPFVSWVLQALGFPVRSLLSDDGVRWFFQHGAESLFGYGVLVGIFALCAFACLRFVGMGESVRRGPLIVCLLFAASLDTLLLLAAFHPRSPLISLTGSLWPSPLAHGLPFALCLGLILVALLYGVLVRAIRDTSTFARFLCSGYTRYAVWMVLLMICAFIFQCLKFVLLPVLPSVS